MSRGKIAIDTSVSTNQSESSEPSAPETGTMLVALKTFCVHHSLPFSAEKAMQGLPLEDGRLKISQFGAAAQNLGLKAEFVKKKPSRVPGLVYPFAALFKDGRIAVVSRSTTDEKNVLVDFGDGRTSDVSVGFLDKECLGTVIYITTLSTNLFSADEQGGHWLWGPVGKFWPTWIYLFFAAFVINLAGLALPLFVMNVYDRVIPYGAISTLWALVTGVGLALIIDFVLRVMRSTLIANASRRVDMTVSSRLFNQAMDAKLSQRTVTSGELANHVREFESVRDFFTSGGLIAIIDLIFIGIFLGLLWYIVGILALVPMLAVPVVLIVTMFLQIPLANAVKKSQNAATNRHSVLIEALSAIETVKAIGAEGVMQRRWEDAVARNVRAGSSIGFWSSLALFFTAFVQQAVSVILIAWGVFLIADGMITIGSLIAANILAGRVLAPIGGIAGTLVRIQQSFSALGILNRFMKLDRDNSASMKSQGHPGEGKIELRDISFAYPKEKKHALDGISLIAAPGERIAILGRVGSGKSTLGKLLNGLYEVDQGAIVLDDTDLRHYPVAEIRAKIGYVSQEPELFTGNLRDNILIAHPGSSEIEEALRISGALAIAQSHPLGLEMPVGERGKSLSGGQRQSVALARALVGNYQTLFLDEPTSQMDSGTEAAFIEAFSKWLKPHHTLIVATHRTSLLKLVNRVIVLDKGKVIADGPKQAVLKQLGRNPVVAQTKGAS